MWVSLVMSLFLNNAAETYHTTTLLVLYLLTTTFLDFSADRWGPLENDPLMTLIVSGPNL
jgi:hypothetical protein